MSCTEAGPLHESYAVIKGMKSLQNDHLTKVTMEVLENTLTTSWLCDLNCNHVSRNMMLLRAVSVRTC